MERKHIALIGLFELVLIGILILLNRSAGVSIWILNFDNYPNFMGRYGVFLLLTPILSSIHAVVLADKGNHTLSLTALLGWPLLATIVFLIINYVTRQQFSAGIGPAI